MRWPSRRPLPPRVGAWNEDHDVGERYKVISNDSERWWLVMDTISPAREVCRCRNKDTAEWVAVAICHYIEGAPGTIKREIAQGPHYQPRRYGD